MSCSPKPDLCVFATLGHSLATWRDVGMLARELALFRALGDAGVTVTFLSYARGDESALASDYAPALRVRSNRLHLPNSLYTRFLPWLQAPSLRAADVLRTNQVKGGGLAVQAARLWNKPLIARLGYLPSDFIGREKGRDDASYGRALAEERTLFEGASVIQVTTAAMADDIAARLPPVAERIRVVPNYVDDSLFKPEGEEAAPVDVLFLGRLDEQKNIALLLDAWAAADWSLRLIGDGPLAPLVEAALLRRPDRLTWLKSQPHESIASHFRAARLVCLPSRYEGHPKALIEAMTCGSAIVATASPGLTGLIESGREGLLVEPSAQALNAAIASLLDDADQARAMGQAARAKALSLYALETVAAQDRQSFDLALVKGPIRR